MPLERAVSSLQDHRPPRACKMSFLCAALKTQKTASSIAQRKLRGRRKLGDGMGLGQGWPVCSLGLNPVVSVTVVRHWRKSQRSRRLYLTCPSVRTLLIQMFADAYSPAASCGSTVVIIPSLRSNRCMMSVGPRRVGCLRMVPFSAVIPAINNLYAGNADFGPYFLKTWVVVG